MEQASAPRPTRRPPRISIDRRDLAGAVVLASFLGLAVFAVSGEWSPAIEPSTAKVRIWLASRASGIVAYLLLSTLAMLGIVLSHPLNKIDWKASKYVFPWHKHLAFFTLAFIVAHIVAIVIDPWAGVGVVGSIVPGLSSYRTVPVALGTLGLYAFLVTGLTARFTNLLGPGRWLTIHRVAIVAFGLAWAHGVLSGSDSRAFLPIYAVTGALVVLLAASRYWRPLERPGAEADASSGRRLAPRFRFQIWR